MTAGTGEWVPAVFFDKGTGSLTVAVRLRLPNRERKRPVPLIFSRMMTLAVQFGANQID